MMDLYPATTFFSDFVHRNRNPDPPSTFDLLGTTFLRESGVPLRHSSTRPLSRSTPVGHTSTQYFESLIVLRVGQFSGGRKLRKVDSGVCAVVPRLRSIEETRDAFKDWVYQTHIFLSIKKCGDLNFSKVYVVIFGLILSTV